VAKKRLGLPTLSKTYPSVGQPVDPVEQQTCGRKGPADDDEGRSALPRHLFSFAAETVAQTSFLQSLLS